MHPGRKGISGGVKCFHAFEKLHDTSKEGSKPNPVLQLASRRIRSANVPNHITQHLHAEKQGKSLTARLVVKLFRPALEPIRVAYNGTTLVVLCSLSLYLPKPYKRQKVGPCLCSRRHSRSPSKSRQCLFPRYVLTFIGGLGAPRPHRPLLRAVPAVVPVPGQSTFPCLSYILPDSPRSHPQKMAGVGPYSCLPFHKSHSPHSFPHYSYHPNYPYHLVFSSPSDELTPFFIPHVSPNTFLFQPPARSEAILSSLYYISPILSALY